mmetsp:Transcript_11657/g.27391  ORF Transcript_11657/g.27391 Transcript_11657/m.27391 type:complete len:101 (+) Transcript_11657:871-1173(+)
MRRAALHSELSGLLITASLPQSTTECNCGRLARRTCDTSALKPASRTTICKEVAVVPINVNGPGPQSEPSEVVHFHPRELEPLKARGREPSVKTRRWVVR